VTSEPDDALRVSDAERDAVLKSLGDHAAAGRLTLDELEERAGKALEAKTRGELTSLTSDLPAAAPEVQPSARKPVRWMIAIMGGSHRRGRFRAASQINALAIMGGHEIDLREAEIEGGELTLTLISIMGGSNVYVPDSVEVEATGVSIMGGHNEEGSARPPRPGAPVIRIRMFNLMGGANIYRLPPQARGVSLAQARRMTRAAGRSGAELPASVDALVGRHLDRAERHVQRHLDRQQRRIDRRQRRWD
jgi:Domain of unknown function (DUF1707)/Cell wall-active antibiotics response 4TMS YvqF